MGNLFNKSFFAFMARLAIICNLAFALSLMKMLFKWFSMPNFIANFLAILGLVASPVVNISFTIWFIVIKLLRYKIEIPFWQTILILFMLLVQILFAIY